MEVLRGRSTDPHRDDVAILELSLAPALTAATAIPSPEVLLKVVGYGPANLPLWRGAHCDHRLGPLDTLLLALTARNEGIDLAPAK